MTDHQCADEACTCTITPEDVVQMQCRECRRYSHPFIRAAGLTEPGMQDDREDGCWVWDGHLCPDCSPANG